MDEKTLEKISAEISSGRMLIPMQNRAKFDTEARRIYEAIKKHGKVDAYARRLLSLWEKRKYYLRTLAGCHLAPPALLRNKKETGAEYLKRCFDIAEGSW